MSLVNKALHYRASKHRAKNSRDSGNMFFCYIEGVMELIGIYIRPEKVFQPSPISFPEGVGVGIGKDPDLMTRSLEARSQVGGRTKLI